MLEMRLHELARTAFRFIIVEAARTHSGRPKPLDLWLVNSSPLTLPIARGAAARGVVLVFWCRGTGCGLVFLVLRNGVWSWVFGATGRGSVCFPRQRLAVYRGPFSLIFERINTTRGSFPHSVDTHERRGHLALINLLSTTITTSSAPCPCPHQHRDRYRRYWGKIIYVVAGGDIHCYIYCMCMCLYTNRIFLLSYTNP
jgi:hypothetical protein